MGKYFLTALFIVAYNVVCSQPFTDMNKDGKLQPYEDNNLPNNARIDNLMQVLTQDEKINLVLGTGMKGFEGLIKDMVVGGTDFLVPGAAGTTYAVDRLGIPAVVMTDGPAGVRISPTRKNTSETYYATGFPVGILLASTWDVKLIEKVGELIGNEVIEYGAEVQLSPAMNIIRNPLCGRNYEYYSEDPLISGKIGSAMTKGLQKNGSGASLKHFAANNSEENRMDLDVHVSQRALREIYLKGFEIVVKESNPATIMSSYNKINGTYTSANYDLLTTILRDEWGFKGLVMTDWFGGYSNSLLALQGKSPEHNSSSQLKAGNDLLMPGIAQQKDDIINDLKSGKLSEQELDICVRRVLNMILNSNKIKDYKFSNKPNLKAHAIVARQSAADGMVLLENNGALPINPNHKKIAVFGSLSYNFIAGGTGSGDVNKAYVVSLTDGLKNAGYILDKNLDKIYTPFVNTELDKVKKQMQINPFMLIPLMPQPAIKDNIIAKTATENDLAIITIGRSSGEMADREVEADFNLTKEELALIEKISSIYHAQNKKVIVVINVGGPIETASWAKKVDAVLMAWLPGQEGGNAVSDVLSGKINPSGKLTTSFPVKYSDVYTSKNFQGLPADMPTNVMYAEGIYVGYRYFSTFNVKPAYEFGYGLSYSKFEMSNVKISDNMFDNEIFVTVDVKNTGLVAGKEVAQLYISAPTNKLDKPAKELRAFEKTKLLNPGETQTLYFSLKAKDLSSFDPAQCSWVAEKGSYNVEIGNSSENIKQKISFTINNDIFVEKVNNVLNNSADFKDLKPSK